VNIRRNIYTLGDDALAAFQAAVNEIKADGTYDDFIRRHHHAMMVATPWSTETPDPEVRNAAHSGPSFLPWHRYFIREFELALRRKRPSVTLPYWDWIADSADPANAPLWNTDPSRRQYVGGSGTLTSGPFANWTALIASSGHSFTPRPGGIKRALGSSAGWAEPVFPTPQQVEDAVGSFPKYDTPNWEWQSTESFRNRLEGWLQLGGERGPQLHNVVHVWIGGDMQVGTSPNDPVFFLHHGNVDRIWALWQHASASRGYLPTSGGPAGHNLNDALVHLTSPGPTPAGSLDYRRTLGYVYDTDPPLVDLATPVLDFDDVPTLETTWRAAVFHVRSPRRVTLEVLGGGPPAPFSLTTLGPTKVHDPPDDNAPFDPVRVWFGFTGEATPGVAPERTAEIRCPETGQTFTVTLRAKTVPRPTTGVVLCLDRSASMSEQAGTGSTRMALLHEAAARCVELTRDGSGVGVVSFNHDARDEIALAPFQSGNSHRGETLGKIAALFPDGATSIGDGVMLSRQQLAAGGGTFDGRALLVMTDGIENQPLFLRDVMGLIDQRSFAIGLGSAEQVSAASLNKLVSNQNGYLLLTGSLGTDVDSYFRLSKYFQQILVTATNESIVVDPSGFVQPGADQLWPFELSEADIDVTVTLLVDVPAVRLRLETPAGETLDESDLEEAGAEVQRGDSMTFVRLGLPSVNGAHAGTWQAVLSVDKRRLRTAISRLAKEGEAGAQLAKLAAERGPRYNLTVSTWSNVRMDGRLIQNSVEPGSEVRLLATLREYGVPIEGAQVIAEIAPPDSPLRQIDLEERRAGEYRGRFEGEYPGAWRVRLLARGAGLSGAPFTREQLLSAAIALGGDNPEPPKPGGEHELAGTPGRRKEPG
jgi:hypothetical protein